MCEIFQVAPAELEALLLKHPDVKDSGVVGVPDDIAGELPKAFVVRKKNSKISEKALQQYVAGKDLVKSSYFAKYLQ